MIYTMIYTMVLRGALRHYTTKGVKKANEINMFERKVLEELDKLPKLNRDNEIMGKRDDNEWGGPRGLEPTRYTDWEQKGRCTDF